VNERPAVTGRWNNHRTEVTEATEVTTQPVWDRLLCVLARPEIFRLVESVLHFFNGQRYALGDGPGKLCPEGA
jgi:hypothetical protein